MVGIVPFAADFRSLEEILFKRAQTNDMNKDSYNKFPAQSCVSTKNSREKDFADHAQSIVADNGPLSVLEQLSLPHSHTDPELLPHLATSVTNALDFNLLIDTPSCSKPQTLPAQLDISVAADIIDSHVLHTGCQSLDNLLGGGIHMDAPAIFEVSGAASAGKTQLMMQLALMCASPTAVGGLDAYSIYVSTEGSTPFSRFWFLSQSLVSRLSLPEGTVLAKRVIIERVHTSESLLHWATWRLPYLLRKTGARLVIIDSIAALYRSDFNDAVLRANHLTLLVRAIRVALIPANAVCVCVNQVSQAPDRFSGNLDKTVPALGASWSNHVSTRVFITRRMATRREAQILHSSYLPHDGGKAMFLIVQEGIVSLDE